MPAGADTALNARRPRGRAAREAESTANVAASVYTEDVVKTASHQAPPVECAARNDSVRTTSPPVHTPRPGSDKGENEHKSDPTPHQIGNQVSGYTPRTGKLSGAKKKSKTKVTVRKSLVKGKAKHNTGGDTKSGGAKSVLLHQAPPKSATRHVAR